MKIVNIFLLGLVALGLTACGGGSSSAVVDNTNLEYTTSLRLGDDIVSMGTYKVCADLNNNFKCEDSENSADMASIKTKDITSSLDGNTYTFTSEDPLLQTAVLLAVLNDGEITFATKAQGEGEESEIGIKSTLEVALMQGGVSEEIANSQVDTFYKNLKLDSDNKDTYVKNILLTLEEISDFNKLYYFVSNINDTIYSDDFNVSKLSSDLNTLNKLVLNDTGIKTYFDGENFLDDEPATFPGQDAASGFDKTDGGFKYKKLDSLGNILSDDATEYSCVKDERTNLIWEIKDDDKQSPRYKFNTFAVEIEGVVSVHDEELKITQCNKGDDLADCKTSTYIKYMNKINYCGKSNWKLPTSMDLFNLVDYSITDKLTDADGYDYYYRVDKEIFKDLYTSADQLSLLDIFDLAYWSSSFFNNYYNRPAHQTISLLTYDEYSAYSLSLCQKEDSVDDCYSPTVLLLRLVSQSK